MTHIEEKLKPLVLSNLEFVLDGKIIRKGKLKIFNTKQFFINFKINDDDQDKEYKLPYPYRVREENKGLVFDYCLSAFCPRTEELYWKMKAMDKSSASKFHENYLHIVSKDH